MSDVGFMTMGDARSSGDFCEADRLRSAIEELGWVVRDVVDGFQLIPKRAA